MSKEKQIEEMLKHIPIRIWAYDVRQNMAYLDEKHSEIVAECLYDAGYRKQSEGRWEKRVFIIFDSEKVGFRCSECNTTWETETHYCPNCGAKMKGGAE